MEKHKSESRKGKLHIVGKAQIGEKLVEVIQPDEIVNSESRSEGCRTSRTKETPNEVAPESPCKKGTAKNDASSIPTTFFGVGNNSDLQKCVVCNGYDENCRVYTDTRRFADKCHRMREEHRKESKLFEGTERQEEEKAK